MHKLTFMNLTYPGRSVASTMMIASIRKFGGALADSPVWVFFPHSLGDFSEQERARFAALGVETIPIEINEKVQNFPFASKVQIAAFAEKMASGKTDLLTWLDSDTLVIAEPNEFLLPKDKTLGYRPVHHKLLGLSWDDEPDPFWALVYRHCQVPSQKIFPMLTHVDEKIRPYFNAGAFVVRPERGILSHWWQVFQSSYRKSDFLPFYEKDSRYAIFMHQAIFTGVLLRMLEQNEMQELSASINYPLHLHKSIPPDLRAEDIENLVTVRYENIFDELGWHEKFSISAELVEWIEAQLYDHRTAGYKN